MVSDTRLILQNGALMQLELRKGYRIHCDEGEAWITVTGISRDFVLAGHESLELPPGRALVEGHGTLRVIRNRPLPLLATLWSIRQLSRLARRLRRAHSTAPVAALH
ncbi:TRAP-type C4-dicarboxylate transport system permease small subunit [Silvimonas terrae]|uniref:TRAP-type C4-dicarboxylate transport system permease small subunit n=1 Tax=Silvimonas terrae TaxID=300266 RepID=A0A840RLS6_9NEIS|nr:DUF2917 domain-containing protein [Silvimonas terrae]MBB5193478.1 TRAP-type C4-dicarboxylate transport system permease small subunit [Silvimonas terrae]